MRLVPVLACALFAFLLTPASAWAGFGFQFNWGTSGMGDSQFVRPTGIAIDSDGDVYVADQGNNRIQKFTFDTFFLKRWGANGGNGTSGTAEGQFRNPYGIATDSSGNVYVTDAFNQRVQKFTSEGAFISTWGWGVANGQAQRQVCTVACQAGIPGSGEGQFSAPTGITVHGSDVYVTDLTNHNVQKFSLDGAFVTKWSSWGSGAGESFASPVGVAVDSTDDIYVTDLSLNRVVKFQGSDNTHMTEWGTSGSGDGQFLSPLGITIDGSDNVFVADYSNNRIQKFTTSGGFVAAGGSSGSGTGQFTSPAGLDVDTNSAIYVADSGNHRVQYGTITKSGTGNVQDGTLRYVAGSGTADKITITYSDPSYTITNVGSGASITPGTLCTSGSGSVTCTGTGVTTLDIELGDQNDEAVIDDSVPPSVLGGIEGESGNDVLQGGDENTQFDGGTGTDTVDYSSAASIVNATVNGAASGDGSDTMVNVENLTGGPAGDVLTGDGNPNVLKGGTGDVIDDLAGGAGGGDTVDYSGAEPPGVNVIVNGLVSGSAGADTLSGFENVTGSSHSDTLTGDVNANVLKGAAGVDTLSGGDGDDTLRGGSENDGITGGNGADTADYTGTLSAVTVNLTAGTAIGATGPDGAGTDTLATVENATGGSAGDTLTGDGGANTLNGAAGGDTVDYSDAGLAVTASLASGTTSGGGGTDTLVNVESLTGSGSDDTLTGDGGLNTLDGAGGDDTLDGRTGNDTLKGGAHNTLGDTVTYSAIESALTVDLSISDPLPQNTGGAAGWDTLSGLENLTGGSGDDLLRGIPAGPGGNNTINGGPGSDTASYSNATSDVTATVNGPVSGGGGTDGLANIENLTGGPANDTLTGDVNANVLSGAGGGDQLFGAAGNDTLDGGANDDLMRGSAGDDSLVGGTGTDEADYSDASANITVNLATSTPQPTGDAGTDTISSTEDLTGGPQNDNLTGNDAVNHIDGGDGGDEIQARDFTADIVNCNAGDDFASADSSDQLVACESTSVADPIGTPGGGPGNGGPDSSPPMIDKLAPGRISSSLGGPFNFVLSESATVSFTIEKRALGRKVKRKCKRQTKKNRRKKVCRYYAPVGSVTATGTAGANAFKFTGKIGGKALKPGPYRLTAVATDAAGNKSKAATVVFAVLR